MQFLDLQPHRLTASSGTFRNDRDLLSGIMCAGQEKRMKAPPPLSLELAVEPESGRLPPVVLAQAEGSGLGVVARVTKITQNHRYRHSITD
jgi:hypothetical protein